jgi:hypothetical protein
MEPTIIGIIGCGNISDAYLKGAARSQLIQVKSCADLNRGSPARPRLRSRGWVESAAASGHTRSSSSRCLTHARCPADHQAGKHVYRKPLAAASPRAH